MPGKHFDLDLSNNLGGEKPSDIFIPSQKAVKTYVDTEINTVDQKVTNKADKTHTQASDTIDALTGYTKDGGTGTLGTSDTLNQALAKLENALDDKQPKGNYISDLSGEDITDALGYTPYNSTNPNGYTSNKGTITGVKMNGEVKGTSGEVDLGEVLTKHQDISNLQTKISTENKLSADLLSEGTTNKLVSATEKSNWNAKLDSSAISDMATQSWVEEQNYLTEVGWNNISDKPTEFKPEAHNQASNTINTMTGYTIASSSSAISTTDSLNVALGKLEYKVNHAVSGGDITVGQLNGPRLEAINATATVFVDKQANKITLFGNTYASGANSFATAILNGTEESVYTEVPITQHSNITCLQYSGKYYNKSTLNVVS